MADRDISLSDLLCGLLSEEKLSTYFDKSRSLYSKYRIFDIVKDKLTDQESKHLKELLSKETVISDTACRIVDDAIAWDDDFRLLDDLMYLDNLVSSVLTDTNVLYLFVH